MTYKSRVDVVVHNGRYRDIEKIATGFWGIKTSKVNIDGGHKFRMPVLAGPSFSQ